MSFSVVLRLLCVGSSLGCIFFYIHGVCCFCLLLYNVCDGFCSVVNGGVGVDVKICQLVFNVVFVGGPVCFAIVYECCFDFRSERILKFG